MELSRGGALRHPRGLEIDPGERSKAQMMRRKLVLCDTTAKKYLKGQKYLLKAVWTD